MSNKFKTPSYKRLTSAINQRNQGSSKNRRKKFYNLVGKIVASQRLLTWYYVNFSGNRKVFIYSMENDYKPVLVLMEEIQEDKTVNKTSFSNKGDCEEIELFDKDGFTINRKQFYNHKTFESFFTRNKEGLVTSYRNSNGVFQEYLNPDFSYMTRLIYERTYDLNKYKIDGAEYSREEALKYLEDIIIDETRIEEHEKAKHLHNLITVHTPMIVE